MSRRPFKGWSSPSTKWRSEFRSFSNGDSVWPRYCQNTLQVSFFSLGLRVLDYLKKLTRKLSKISFCDRFLLSPEWKKSNFSHLWDLRLADTATPATRSHRWIEAPALVLWCIKNMNSTIVKRPCCGRSLLSQRWKIWIGKKSALGIINPERTPRRKIFRIRGLI